MLLSFNAGATDIGDLHGNNSQGVSDSLGEIVTVVGVITVGTGTFCTTYTDCYLQDATAGIMLYHPRIPATFAVGDSVQITGEVEQYRGMTEIVPDSALIHILSSGATIPETLLVTCQDVDEIFQPDYSEPNEGRLVRINDVTYSGTWPSPGNSGGVDISDGRGTCEMYIDRDTDLDDMTPPSGTFSVVGVVKQYDGYSPPFTSGYELLPRSSLDIILPNAPRIVAGPEETAIQPTSVSIEWETDVLSSSVVEYGLTAAYGSEVSDATMVIDHSVELSSLTPGTIYHYRVKSTDANGTTISGDRVFCSGSAAGSTGEIQIYFNKSVETSYSTGTDAETVPDLSGKVIEKINAAQHTLDVCFYSFSLSGVRDALIAAHNRGVDVRYIYECDNWTTYIGNLTSAGITCIADDYGSNDGDGIMHNKSIIFDADTRGDTDPSDDWIMSGSWNATISGNNPSQNHQNLIFIQDQSLATAYTEEFEEMWGSSTMTPSAVNSRFGANKTDNTPHKFVVNGRDVELYMSPSDAVSQHMADKILSASESCYFALMSFTRLTQANALEDMWYYHDPCFQLKGVFDSAQGSPGAYSRYHDMVADPYAEYPWDPVADDVHLDGEGGTLHHKYAIIDVNDADGDPIVITGSHNWSSAAENYNDENTLMIHCAQTANIYLQEFAARYHNAASGGGTQELVPAHELLVTVTPQSQNLLIEWDPIACGYSYVLYRFTEAFGDTTGVAPLTTMTTPTSYTDVGVLGSDTVNYFYLLLPRNMYDEPFGDGVRFGEFDFSSGVLPGCKTPSPTPKEER